MKCNEIIELFPDILKNPLQAAKVDLWETEEIRVRQGSVFPSGCGAENGDWKFVIRWKRSGRSFLIWPIILSMLMRERSARAILRFREDIDWDW